MRTAPLGSVILAHESMQWIEASLYYQNSVSATETTGGPDIILGDEWKVILSFVQGPVFRHTCRVKSGTEKCLETIRHSQCTIDVLKRSQFSQLSQTQYKFSSPPRPCIRWLHSYFKYKRAAQNKICIVSPIFVPKFAERSSCGKPTCRWKVAQEGKHSSCT